MGHDEIVFLGEVHDPAGFHGLCDVSVLASVREGLSISLQEAMATACVPVAGDGVGCRELVRDGENGYLFQPGDVNSLSEKILQALEDPSLALLGDTGQRDHPGRFRYQGKRIEIYQPLRGAAPMTPRSFVVCSVNSHT